MPKQPARILALRRAAAETLAGLNFTFAPPSRLVSSFFGVGAFFYLVAALVFWKIDLLHIHYLEPQAVGFMHLYLLGFMMSVIFGAMYQLISVVLEIPLYSNDLAYAHLLLFILGMTGFVWTLLDPSSFTFLGYGSVVLYVSFLLYVTNIFFSLKALKKRDIKAIFIIVTHGILFVGVTYGLLSALGLVHGLGFDTTALAHTHIVLSLFGFAGGLLMIIATVLLPMFMLSHNFDKKISDYLLGLILLASLGAVLDWFLLVKLVMMAAVALFCYQLYDIYKKRIRKKQDIYSLELLSAGGFLLLAAVLIPFLAHEMALKLFAIVLLFGFISSFLVGHIYKIVPFLVWNDKFAPHVGTKKVPMLHDMVHAKGSYFEYGAKMAAILFLSLGVLLQSGWILEIGKWLLIINALAVAANVVYIFKYDA